MQYIYKFSQANAFYFNELIEVYQMNKTQIIIYEHSIFARLHKYKILKLNCKISSIVIKIIHKLSESIKS